MMEESGRGVRLKFRNYGEWRGGARQTSAIFKRNERQAGAMNPEEKSLSSQVGSRYLSAHSQFSRAIRFN